ncbi:O-antigen ligase family protein [Candidatus Gottesmanbacteria bacterium]|nr:O-antigen ligase family protein [Candidatus Gottesmanbacteria bacterium]
MSKENILSYLNTIIKWGFILLFFLVPLVFTPWNSELFEYNKMMLTYGLTAIIACGFLIKSVLRGKIEITKTPFDIPILLFLISQILSTIFSIDPHTSIWGYYSRFHGGLMSTISYILLFYIFVSEYAKDRKTILTIVKTGIISAVVVSIYAILQRLGADKHIWVQDVQNRVFSSLGQPNWLAAYFSVIIPTSLALFLKEKNNRLIYIILSVVFFSVIIFTRSRSGFVGLAAGLLVMLLVSKVMFSKKGALIILLFGILSFVFGTPFTQLQKYTLPYIVNQITAKPDLQNNQEAEKTTPVGQLIEYGGTESGAIRSIVWKGAIDVFKHNPWFGSGVETFAYSYYQFRPIEHNMTSEWDFLYNKVHNEYLNFAATTGIVGLSAYLLIIAAFIIFSVLAIRSSEDKIMLSAFLGAYISILVSNFWGFSVVIVAIYFFILPAFSFISSKKFETKTLKFNLTNRVIFQKTISGILLIVTCYVLFVLIQMWRADAAYNLGSQYSKANQYLNSYQELKKAVSLNPNEPTFKDQLAITESNLALIAYQEKQVPTPSGRDSDQSVGKDIYGQLSTDALNLSESLVNQYPKNVNFWKTRTRVLFTLSEVNPAYLTTALTSLQKAWELAPNDTKIVYNIGLLYARLGNNEKAIELLQKSADLKPNYYEPHWALALFYEQLGENQKAKDELNFITTNIRPDDQAALDKLKEL